MDDAHEYLATRRAMDVVGISEEEQVNLPEFYFLMKWNFFKVAIMICQYTSGGNI